MHQMGERDGGKMPLTPDQEAKLEEVLQLAENEKLNTWEQNFLTELAGKYEEFGVDVIISSKMWVILDRIDDKIRG